MRKYPPLAAFSNSNIDVYDPIYIRNLPTTRAYGFTLCKKLAFDTPQVANQNCDSVAYCALGKPDFHLSKHHWKSEKSSPLEYRSISPQE